MAKISTAGGMTFNVGKKTLADGSPISFPKQNIVPGDPVFKNGEYLPNGTYQTADQEFTVAGGIVGKVGPKPVVAVVVDPVIDPVADPKIEPVVDPVIDPANPPAEPVIVTDPIKVEPVIDPVIVTDPIVDPK